MRYIVETSSHLAYIHRLECVAEVILEDDANFIISEEQANALKHPKAYQLQECADELEGLLDE